MRLRSYPRGKSVDEKRCAHSDYENNYDTDDKVFNHIAGVDFLFVLVSDSDFDTDVCTPNDDDRRQSHYDIDPKRIHKGLKFADDFGEIFVESCCK